MKQARAWMMAAILTVSGASVFTACTSYDDNPVLPPQGIAIDETNFPDEYFRALLLEHEYGKDGVFTNEEISKITEFHFENEYIESLKGIEYFTALEYLNCDNCEIEEVDISKNTKLKYINFADNYLESLDVSNNEKLVSLRCEYNFITELNASNNPELMYLDCYFNELTSLDVSNNKKLYQLDFEDNKLTSIDLRQNTELRELYFSGNEFTSIDLSNNPKLTLLHLYDNKISGQEMDNIINCLPQNTSGKEYEFAVYSINGEREDKNVCTKSQVEAVKAKGWTPQYFDFDEYDFFNYEGSDE